MIKMIARPAEFFRAECNECHATLEYVFDDIDSGYIQCPHCNMWISHRAFGTPFWIRKDEDTDERIRK